MDDLSRSEYPAMLAHLQPAQAVTAVQDRVRRIFKINTDIAEWLQERRRVEEQYVAGLRKLLLFKVPNSSSELGIFQTPWDKILQSADSIAASHHLYAQRIEKDVENSLRSFQNRKEMVNMSNITGNLQSMARELEDAQDKSDKLSKKGGRANAQKVDAAASRLEGAHSQWESQAPFIFETLQAVDEQRINHLRDVLTQLETHEVDQATRTQAAAEEALNVMLEINTTTEILSWSEKVTSGKPRIERKSTTTRQNSVAGGSLAAPSISGHEDDQSDYSVPRNNDPPPEASKLRSRIGTMLGRRRQSTHGSFGPISRNNSGYSRGLGSSHSQGVSPRGSSHNLAASNRLSSLAETPDSPPPTGSTVDKEKQSHDDGPNGVGHATASDALATSKTVVNGTTTAEDIFDAPPPLGPPPSHQVAADSGAGGASAKDEEGYTVPPTMNDPISQAQKEAAALSEEHDQLFKLNIQNEPVAEEDADAKKAAISSVANTLSLGMPSRRGGTVRGRRDVRNTIYVPSSPLPDNTSERLSTIPGSPPSMSSRPSAVAALASEASVAGTSDTQSVRSATSLGSLVHSKHPDMQEPGLNSSIIETVSATFEGEEVKNVKISGEIAFSYNMDATSSLADHETIRIDNFPSLEVIGPNRIFVSNTASPDEFTLDTSHLQKTSVAFTYRAHAAESTSLAANCPLEIKPAWKSTGDKLGLVVQYRLRPSSSASSASVAPLPLALHNVVFVAVYEGARASGVQTKPAGTHLKDKHLVYWRMGDLTLTEEWSKIICRVVGEQGAEPKPGHIEARWELTAPTGSERQTGLGIAVSRLQEGKGKGKAVEVEADPFADESASPRPADSSWMDVPLVKKVVSGRYEAI